jgi:hypothetical protein
VAIMQIRRIGLVDTTDARERNLMGEIDELLGLRERQGSQQYGFHYTEDCYARADAERQRQQRRDRERWSAKKPPKRVTNHWCQRSHRGVRWVARGRGVEQATRLPRDRPDQTGGIVF